MMNEKEKLYAGIIPGISSIGGDMKQLLGFVWIHMDACHIRSRSQYDF